MEANRLFEGFSRQERDRAIPACVRKRYRRGEAVFSAGDPPEFLYLLEAGHVRLVSLAEDGTERILHIFRPGDIFGEILLSVERRPFSAVAVDKARVAIGTLPASRGQAWVVKRLDVLLGMPLDPETQAFLALSYAHTAVNALLRQYRTPI